MVITRNQHKRFNDSSDDSSGESSESEFDFSESETSESDFDSVSSDEEPNNYIIKVIKQKREREDDYIEEPPSKFSKQEEEYLEQLEIDERDRLITENDRLMELINPNNVPLRFKIINSKASDTQKCVLLKKYDHINDMGPFSSEAGKYVMWVESACKLPLGIYTPMKITKDASSKEISNFLNDAKRILDEAVYGHTETKDQIIRIMAQWIAKPESKGNVIGITGKYGVGKTSLIKRGVSKALGLPFAFISLGGANDGSFLTGHSFTYEGSLYGKIAEILMSVGTMNPIIFFDELDKISTSNRGNEINGILTHLTDPIQNERFNDNYFTELDLDLSKSLIVFSYNEEDLINPILRDRMITIRVNGYTTTDKINICQKHMIAEILQEFNIPRHDIIISDDVIKKLIQKVPDEEGVRNLKRGLESIISWINMERLIKGPEKIKFPFTITDEHVDKYVIKKNIHTGPLHMYI